MSYTWKKLLEDIQSMSEERQLDNVSIVLDTGEVFGITGIAKIEEFPECSDVLDENASVLYIK